MAKVELSKDQARELYYNINSYYVSLKMADNVDKFYFDKLKFWSPTMNNHLSRARNSIKELLSEFNKQFKAVDSDIVDYDTPSELLELMQMVSRMSPEKIREIKESIL